MADLAPAQIYSLNLGLSEVGNKINQIQQQLDKTEDLVNNLSQIKLNQDTSLMFERQVQMEEPDPDAGQIADRDEAYLVQLPTVVLATVGTAVLSGILFSAITFLSDLVQCPNTTTNTTTSLDAVTGGLCSVLSQPLLLSQALVLGPILAVAVATGIMIGEVEFLQDETNDVM